MKQHTSHALMLLIVMFSSMTIASATAIEAVASQPKQVTITVFAEGNASEPQGDLCRYKQDVPNRPLRLEQIGDLPEGKTGVIVTIPLRNGGKVLSGNDIVPQSTGCVFRKSTNLNPNSDYRVTLGNDEIATLPSESINAQDELLLILTQDGVSSKSEDMWVRPTPAPTSIPKQSPTPTTTPIPAGEQSDGEYLLRGNLTLNDDRAIALVDSCFGTGGYQDIGSGTKVVVRDGDNSILGLGELSSHGTSETSVGCTFTFEVIVEESDFYQIEITHRGTLIYTFEDLENAGWTIHLTLGD